MNDKLAEYGPGPWVDEPDRVEFYAHGLPCLLRRTPLGAWCGYAAVPPGHPLHGHKDWEGHGLDVHGGVTFVGPCHGEICHVPGESDQVWWFGFDCAHAWDLVPGMKRLWEEAGKRLGLSSDYGPFRSEYRDLAYVTAETTRLAEQLAQYATHHHPLNSISCEED